MSLLPWEQIFDEMTPVYISNPGTVPIHIKIQLPVVFLKQRRHFSIDLVDVSCLMFMAALFCRLLQN